MAGFTCYFVRSDTEKSFPDLRSAMEAAAEYCGNNRYVKPFREEHTYLFGPGTGETTVMVRPALKFKSEPGNKGE